MWQLILTRLREFYREPAAVFWVYCFPLLMTFTLGLAFRAEPMVTYLVTVVESEKSAAIKKQLTDDEAKRFQKTEVLDYDKARILLRTGKTELVIIPDDIVLSRSEKQIGEEVDVATGDVSESGVGNNTSEQSKPTVTYWYDPRNQKSDLARKAVDDYLQREAGRDDVFLASNKIMDEPGGRYIDFLIPGLICMNLMGSGLWGVGFAIVDMRIRGLLKRFIATPMKRRDFMLAAMVSRLFFLIPELFLLVLFARYFFDVQVYGNVFLVFGLILLGSFQFAGIGLMVASRAKTIETVSGLMNLVMLPNWIFAGIFFSSSNFPSVLQWFVQALPLTPLVDALRAVMLEGSGAMDILPQLTAILLWTFFSFLIALKAFRWN
jgi:ABC-type multidrug transport system permease subunit